MRATRTARGTTSKKQKLAVKGDVTGVLVTPITAAGPSSPPTAAPAVPAPAPTPVAPAPVGSPPARTEAVGTGARHVPAARASVRRAWRSPVFFVLSALWSSTSYRTHHAPCTSSSRSCAPRGLLGAGVRRRLVVQRPSVGWQRECDDAASARVAAKRDARAGACAGVKRNGALVLRLVAHVDRCIHATDAILLRRAGPRRCSRSPSPVCTTGRSPKRANTTCCRRRLWRPTSSGPPLQHERRPRRRSLGKVGHACSAAIVEPARSDKKLTARLVTRWAGGHEGRIDRQPLIRATRRSSSLCIRSLGA